MTTVLHVHMFLKKFILSKFSLSTIIIYKLSKKNG